jgi:hypothetical protein
MSYFIFFLKKLSFVLSVVFNIYIFTSEKKNVCSHASGYQCNRKVHIQKLILILFIGRHELCHTRNNALQKAGSMKCDKCE